MAARALLIALVASCGGDNNAAIAIDGAPLIALTEGEPSAIAISIDEAPGDGDCALPLDANSLSASIVGSDGSDGGDPLELFDVFALRADAAGLVLELEPRCDLMAPGDPDRLLELEVSSVSGCARSARARLQISSAPATGCAPRVLAWTGDCSVVPEDAGDALAIAAGPTPEPLCVSFRSRDEGRETLAIRSDTDFPNHVLDKDDLPTADQVDSSALFSVPLADTSNLAGTFALDYQVFLTDVSAGAIADFTGAITILVGDADLAIDFPIVPDPVPELAVTGIPVRLWSPGRGGPIALCARATRVDPGFTPLARTKPFARLENPISGDGSASKFVCGDDFRLAVSPPIDALATEEVVIEAAYCNSCSDDPVPITAPITRTLSIPTESLVEEVSCPGNADFDIDLACADLSGDGSPELLFRSGNSLLGRTCVFAGDESRLSQVPFAAGSTGTPIRVTSLIWRDPDNGPTPVVLGRFTSGATIRRLAIDPATEATWAAATELGIDAVQTRLDTTVALADDLSGGATHLARFDNARQGIEITCIAPNDPVITGCQDLSLPALLTGSENFRGLGGFDIDGDGDLDLAAYEGDGTGESPIRIHVFRLSWPNANAPQVDESFDRNTAISANEVAVAVGDVPGCLAPPCRQQVFAVDHGTGHGNGIAEFARLASGPLSDLERGVEPTLGPTRGAGSANARPLVATAYGVTIPIAIGTANTSFELVDPVLIEEQFFGPQQQQPGTYGVDVEDCAGAAVPTFAAVVSASRARLVSRDVSVENF